jgi:hypothetical protein
MINVWIMEFEQSGPLRTLPGETFGDESTLKTDKSNRFLSHRSLYTTSTGTLYLCALSDGSTCASTIFGPGQGDLLSSSFPTSIAARAESAARRLVARMQATFLRVLDCSLQTASTQNAPMTLKQFSISRSQTAQPKIRQATALLALVLFVFVRVGAAALR